MLYMKAFQAFLGDVKNIKDIWKNKDDSLSILFNSSDMKANICMDENLKNFFESRHGYSELDGEVIVYIGVLTLVEGLAHLYVPALGGVIEHV